MNFHEIEEKWVKKWEESKIFEANPNKKKKIFVTFPFPYMNGPLHLGHAFTSARVDVYARFKRMQGYNVLFPWAWHITGEPIAGAARRVKQGDEIQLRIFREIDKVPDEELQKFTDPEYIAKYYIRESRETLKRFGHGIDWRREFTTTSLHEQFNKFIEWQYLTLKERGYVKKGTHPVVWCPNCKSPTGDHDRLEGEGAIPVEFILLKFEYEDAFLPAATLRPETIFGVVNMWVNPHSTMVKAEVDGEIWIVSKEAIEKLREQREYVRVIEEFKGEKLIGKYCIHPLTKNKILILPAEFVNPDNATGVVMSVPSHAPYDWIALKDLLQNPEELNKYGIDVEEVKKIKPISLISTPEFGEHPAIEVCDKLNIKDQRDKKLDKATEIVYKEEFYKGILKENTGKYSGMKVSEAKKILIRDFEEEGIATRMYETSEKVVCRCTTKCVVKILKDQWFLRYSDESWKEKVRKALKKIKILPEEARANFENVIEWLEDKACARKTGLGTPLPWDKEWKVETLSDSTVYMAFYTISKHIYEYNIKGENLAPPVFDYIFYGKGDIEEISKKYKIPEKALKEMREEFEYWYPVDLRISAKELIPNHLTFFIFQHVALFPDKLPKCIGVNGMISIEGQKMSKSKGNFITMKDAIAKYGADVTRATLLYSAEGLKDPDWRAKSAQDMKNKLKSFYNLALKIISLESDRKEVKNIDKWLLSRMQSHIRKATEHYESLNNRSAFQVAFFDVWQDIKWYLRRDKPNKEILLRVLEDWTKLLAPYIPMLCEEIWEKLGKEGFISLASFPTYDKNLIDKKAEMGEEMVMTLYDDVENILKVTKLEPSRIIFYVSPIWKWKLVKIAESHNFDFKSTIKEAMKDPEIKKHGKEAVNYINEIIKEKLRVPEYLDEMKILEESKIFFENEFKAKIEILPSDNEVYDPLNKRKQSKPLKPAIYVE